MDAYQVRTWEGWHHHMVLTLMAVWFLIGETHRGQQLTPALTLPQVRYGLSVLLLEGFCALSIAFRMVKISKTACHLWRSIPGNLNRRPITLTLEAVPANFPEADLGSARSGPYYSSRQSTHDARPHQR